jgi:hypothetical protein
LKGWKCKEESEQSSFTPEEVLTPEELSVHVRSHFYVYSNDLRYLPTGDLEETLEFLACVAHGAALDGATKMVILDALNTFTEDPRSVGREYTGFKNQAELDQHLRKRICCAL